MNNFLDHSTSVPRGTSSTLSSSWNEFYYSCSFSSFSLVPWFWSRLFNLDFDFFSFFVLPLTFALLSFSWKTYFKSTSFRCYVSYSWATGSGNTGFDSWMTEWAYSIKGRSLSASVIWVCLGVGSTSSVSIRIDFSPFFLRYCRVLRISSPMACLTLVTHLYPLRLS